MTGQPEQIVTRVFEPMAVPFDLKRAAKFLRLRADSPQYTALMALVRQEYADCLLQFTPRYQYRIFDIEQVRLVERQVVLSDGVVLDGAAVLRRLRGAAAAVLFVLSAGDAYCSGNGDAEVERQFVRDAVASTMAHGVLRLLQGELQGLGRWSVTPWLSPGYPGWALVQQRVLFAALQPQRIGVRLSETCFMQPQKSVSGLFGLRPIRVGENDPRRELLSRC